MSDSHRYLLNFILVINVEEGHLKNAPSPFKHSRIHLDIFVMHILLFVQKIEEQLKGLPDVKGTKYIEMGRFQMEVKG